MNFKKVIVVLGSVIFAASLNASELVGKMNAYKITIVDGIENRVEAKSVDPDDIIMYEMLYTNKSKEDYNNVGIKGKIPYGTTLIKSSVTNTPSPYFSIDEGQSWSLKPTVKKLEKGKIVEKVSAIEDYNGIKWDIKEIKAGKTIVLTYRISVNSEK
jgi:uncharacterized repeat protein (TIGR01451 family)